MQTNKGRNKQTNWHEEPREHPRKQQMEENEDDEKGKNEMYKNVERKK